MPVLSFYIYCIKVTHFYPHHIFIQFFSHHVDPLLGVNHLIILFLRTNRTTSRNHSTFETNVAAPAFFVSAFLLAGNRTACSFVDPPFFTRVCSRYVHDEKEVETGGFKPSIFSTILDENKRLRPLDHRRPTRYSDRKFKSNLYIFLYPNTNMSPLNEAINNSTTHPGHIQINSLKAFTPPPI